MSRYFNRISIGVIAILTSINFTACSNEDVNKTSNNEVEMRTITITADESPISRTSYEDSKNYLSVSWKEGDVIYIGKANNTTSSEIQINKEGSGFYAFTVTSVNDKTATFTGSIPKDMTGKLLAFYGKKENIKITTDNKVKLNFQTQNWNNSNATENIFSAHLSDYDFMSASIENYQGEDNVNLHFKHEGAVLRLSLAGLPVNSPLSTLRLETTNSSKDFYSYVLFDSNGQVTQQTTYDYLAFNIAKVTTDSEGKVVLYRTICPTSFTTNSINISVNCSLEKGDYTYSKTLNGVSALEAGKFYYTLEQTLTADNFIKGNGSEKDPFIIDNPEKLIIITEQINNGTISNGGSGKYFEISRNIDMTGKTWTPIGIINNYTDGFNGKLYGKKLDDGSLVTISGIDYTSTDANVNAAFIHKAHSSSYIHDLKIIGNFKGISQYTAGIVAQGYNITVENCTFEGTVTHNSEITSTNCVGGIIGFSNLGNCSGCTNLGTIKLESSGSTANYSAGIIGGIQTKDSPGTFNVKGCHNDGEIINKKNGNISGIVGNYSTASGTVNIEDCTLGTNSKPAEGTNGSILRYFSYGPAGDNRTSVVNIKANGEIIKTLNAGGGVSQYPLN